MSRYLELREESNKLRGLVIKYYCEKLKGIKSNISKKDDYLNRKRLKNIDSKLKKIESCIAAYSTPNANYSRKIKL